MIYACVDLGSNSFHLLIARWENDEVQIVERFSEKVQLGEGVPQTGRINEAAYARGVACLEHFRKVIDSHPVTQYWAVGTNALRHADNASQFLAEAARLGLDVSVISGTQEAILVYAGVTGALPASDDTRLVVDIGGGSTELILGRGQTRLLTHSMPIGCVSWRDRYFAEQSQDVEVVDELLTRAVEAAEAVFRPLYPALADHYPWQFAYASSGTMKMLAQICNEMYGTGKQIEFENLKDLRPEILKVATDMEFTLPGLREVRRELLLPGWAVLTGLMQSCHISAVQFSPAALREGMLHFMINDN